MVRRQIHNARTFLFVPATRSERIGKAIASGADVVIVDLEDAVAPADKAVARSALMGWLDTNPGSTLAVRINAADTAWHEEDLAACQHPAISMVVLPKAETANQIERVRSLSGKQVVPIIETGAGLENLGQIARAPGCARLSFGKLDLAVELDLVPDESDLEETVFLPYRAMLVLASQRASLPAPIDGVFTDVSDKPALAHYAKRGRRHGFGGMLLIHPSQVATAQAAFTPTQAEAGWAQAVCAAASAMGGGVVVFDGRMVDAPVIARAKRILASLELGVDGQSIPVD
jgi:citrate lyase beta subunit